MNFARHKGYCYLTDPQQYRLRCARRSRLIARMASLGVALTMVVGLGVEMQGSHLQAQFFSHYVKTVHWQLQSGAAERIWFPSEGPYPVRLGYTRLRDLTNRLSGKRFKVSAQSRQSDRFLEIVERGLNPIYQEKSPAGLSILDRNDNVLYSRRYPERQYARFEDIPELLIGALLFIENRDLLDVASENRNPAVDWGRLARVATTQGLNKLNLGGGRAGGSTLATQIEKYRYSAGGRTRDAEDKLRQMISASLRAYRHGTETIAMRRQIVLNYLNSVPLGGVPRYGEVNGIGDGLWAWFGAEFTQTNQLLGDQNARLELRARALKQVLMLLVAQRRPSGMLGAREGRGMLERLTDSHLRLLGDEGLISPEMLAAALPIKLVPTGPPTVESQPSFVERKAVNEIRVTLGELFSTADLYALDRWDVDVHSSLDGAAQSAVTRFLGRLSSPEFVRCVGLNGTRMLERGDLHAVHYSFTLFEATPLGNLLRVQADNLDQPLDINAGTKLDLGSSAKLRTLISYLNVIAELHDRYHTLDEAALRAIPRPVSASLSNWAIDHFLSAKERSLESMLEAAMVRRYSASPHEVFFTGGGIHRFSNFKREDDSQNPSVAEALEQSINLAFVRIMRDVVHYRAYEAISAPGRGLLRGDESIRRAYLNRFAEREGLVHLRTYWHKYRGIAPDSRLAALADGVPLRRPMQTAAYFGAFPESDFEAFAHHMTGRLGANAGGREILRSIYDRHRRLQLSLTDYGYQAKVHPLELWLVRYLGKNPGADLKDIIAASEGARRDAARWVLDSRFRHVQDQRIAIVVELLAFERIAEEWKRLGYPFDQLVPSLATAIGSSADRPAALAELMGILVNEGIRRPTVEIEEVRFAAETPFDTQFIRTSMPGIRVVPEEVARVARAAMLRVVNNGTARRVKDVFRDRHGSVLAVGGKTGTGDHRSKVVDRNGNVVSSRVMNRAATFTFFIGDRHFGVVTAFVPGGKAANYDFTSSVPVQILKELEPVLRPVVNGEHQGSMGCN